MRGLANQRLQLLDLGARVGFTHADECLPMPHLAAHDSSRNEAITLHGLEVFREARAPLITTLRFQLGNISSCNLTIILGDRIWILADTETELK